MIRVNTFNRLKSQFSSRSKFLSLYHMEGNMLVLSRKSMESIEIGDSVVVKVLEIRGNKVRIGIDAPKEIHVLRTELQGQVSDPYGNGSSATSRSDGFVRSL